MTDAVAAFQMTLPRNTPVASPVSVSCPLGMSDVTLIKVSFPPGCAGLAGARVLYAHNPVYPIGASSWFVFDDYIEEFDVTNQSTSGQWQIQGYNTDFYQHVVTVYFYFNYIRGQAQGPASSPISL